MQIEIELKAHVDDTESVAKKLDALAAYQGTYKKEDQYYVQDGLNNVQGALDLPLSGVRIRVESFCDHGGKETVKTTVNYKTKECRDGIEVNTENEFEIVGNAAHKQIEYLFLTLGLKHGVHKIKQGRLWKYGIEETPISAELSLVEGLGYFLELEILSDRDDKAVIEASRKRLLDLLELCGIEKEKIENRYYSEMLQNLPSL
ncbi:MAG: hypothetical protein Ta2G_05860 [Termitinemataceae bacterium]|nr:MAG: hypothetical protein Ta2G_05860 [Termitinemataceae bacterium]